LRRWRGDQSVSSVLNFFASRELNHEFLGRFVGREFPGRMQRAFKHFGHAKKCPV
jgi:hypothetical protein